MTPLGMIAGQAAGALFGIGTKAASQQMDYKQQEKLQALQIKGQKELSDYSYNQQMRMWNETNYGAQVEHMKNAGLNPALLYGMGGAGGATTGSNGAGQVSGGSNVSSPIMGLNMAREMAEIKNIEADTKAKEATIPKTQAETQDILQGITNKKAQEVLTRVQTALTNLDVQLKGATLEDAADIVKYQAYKLQNEVNLLSNDLEVSNETKEDRKALVSAELVYKLVQSQLGESQIQVNVAQIKNWMVQQAQGWAKLSLDERNTKVQELLGQFNTSLSRELLGSLGGIISTIITRGTVSKVQTIK